jgi:hypothetical protein
MSKNSEKKKNSEVNTTVNNDFQKKKTKKKNDIDSEKKKTTVELNDSKQNNSHLHPIGVLLKAIEIAQSRGAFNIEEALTISQAHKIISDEFYDK